MQALRQADQIKRLHANYASARAINVGYEKEGDRNSKRQDYEQEASSMCAISDQEVAAYADRCQQDPGFERNPVPPSGLGVALRVQDIVHPRKDERVHRRRHLAHAETQGRRATRRGALEAED